MANQPRTRKRVHAIRRASDGSAFQKCNSCGVLVAVALADMHDCESKKDVKRFKGECRNPNPKSDTEQRFQVQPRSPFRLFMESFLESCKSRNHVEVDRKGFETWRNMSKKERQPYVLKAEQVDSIYIRALLKEVEDMAQADDEADSAEVGKYDKYYEEDSENSDGYESFWSVSSETDVLYCNPSPLVKFKSHALASNWPC